MVPSYLLRRVINYLWETRRGHEDARLRLRHDNGDELHVEWGEFYDTIHVRHFAKQPDGVLIKHEEVVCFVDRYGPWIPIARQQVHEEPVVYGVVGGETRSLHIQDNAGQQALAAFCDVWAMRLLEVGWLANAARHQPRQHTGIKRPRWPEPTTVAPDLETLEAWMWDDGGCEATDGCWTEVDGVCQHGHPSWFLRLGLI